MKRGVKPENVKTLLTFQEMITAAWAYHVKGVDQHTIAAMYGVNAGRVSEACATIERALRGEKKGAVNG